MSDFSNALVAELANYHIHNSERSLPLTVEIIMTVNRGPHVNAHNFGIKAHMDVMVRCSHTFGYVV